MIEINRGRSPYIYRIDPNDPKRIQRRANQHHARWHAWATYGSATDAKIALLKIEREGEPE